VGDPPEAARWFPWGGGPCCAGKAWWGPDFSFKEVALQKALEGAGIRKSLWAEDSDDGWWGWWGWWWWWWAWSGIRKRLPAASPGIRGMWGGSMRL
jgi:hypothetical protein